MRGIGDISWIRFFPQLWNVNICIRVHQQIKSAWLSQEWQECNRGCDLTNDGLNFTGDFFFGFLDDSTFRSTLLIPNWMLQNRKRNGLDGIAYWPSFGFSVWMSNTHLSKTCRDEMLDTTITNFWTSPPSSHSIWKKVRKMFEMRKWKNKWFYLKVGSSHHLNIFSAQHLLPWTLEDHISWSVRNLQEDKSLVDKEYLRRKK